MRISDWSSDVCSSDLKFASLPPSQQVEAMSTISDIVQQQEEELLQNLELALQRGRMQVQDPVLQQLYDNFLEALLSEPAPSPQELMSMFSSIVNRYFDLLFPKMTDALDTFLPNRSEERLVGKECISSCST